MKTPRHGQRKGNFVYHARKGWRRDSASKNEVASKGFVKIQDFITRCM